MGLACVNCERCRRRFELIRRRSADSSATTVSVTMVVVVETRGRSRSSWDEPCCDAAGIALSRYTYDDVGDRNVE